MSAERFIVRVRRLDTRLGAGRWHWAERNRHAIAAHWAERVAEKPRMFNGRILVIADGRIVGDHPPLAPQQIADLLISLEVAS